MAERSWGTYALIGVGGIAAGILVYHLLAKRQEEKKSMLSLILDTLRGGDGSTKFLPGMKGWRGIHGLDVETPRVRDPNYYVGRGIAEAAEPPGFPFDDDSERRVSKRAALIMQYL